MKIVNSKITQPLYRMLVISTIGLVVGTVSAFATVYFVKMVQQLNHFFLISPASRQDQSAALINFVTIIATTCGGLVVGLILRFGVSTQKPLGPPDTIYSVQLRKKLPDPKSGFFSTLAAILSLGCGASVGQYGPLVYLGSLVGQLAGKLQLGVRDVQSTAIACGVAAAISTAFNAPIAGLIFTHEVILRHYSPRIFTAVTVATACGYVVANVVFNRPPLFLIEFKGNYHATEFLLFAVEGLVCGLIAVSFMKLLKLSSQTANKLPLPAPCKPMLAGFLLGIVALQMPELLGAGKQVLTQATLPGSYNALELSTILIGKILVTVVCIGFGFAGGVILPSLLIGTVFGALFAISVPEVLLTEYSGLSVYAVCGMVAVMSPVIGAPLTAVLIIFELTRAYEITIAAMVTLVFSNLVAYHWYGRSLFDTALKEQRGFDLSFGRDRAYLDQQQVVKYATQQLPSVKNDMTCGDLATQLHQQSLQTAVVIDAGGRYLGLTYLDYLERKDAETPLSALEFEPQALIFDEKTSLWSAMQSLEGYIGEAVPVVNSIYGWYLGVVPESAVISAYLKEIHDLRREEHEA